MTKEEINKLVALYIVGIGKSGKPNSYLWLEVQPDMKDLDQHLTLLGALKDADLISESGYFLTLRPKGLAMLEKIKGLYLDKKPTVTT